MRYLWASFKCTTNRGENIHPKPARMQLLNITHVLWSTKCFEGHWETNNLKKRKNWNIFQKSLVVFFKPKICYAVLLLKFRNVSWKNKFTLLFTHMGVMMNEVFFWVNSFHSALSVSAYCVHKNLLSSSMEHLTGTHSKTFWGTNYPLSWPRKSSWPSFSTYYWTFFFITLSFFLWYILVEAF